MRKAFLRHLSPATVISMIALFVAIGGSAAIALPGKKNIDANDLKQNVIASKNVKPDALTGADINEGSLAPDTYGASVNASGNLVDSTDPGITSSQAASNVFYVNFPRDVVDCVPVASGVFSDGVVALQSGTANPKRVTVTHFGVAHDFNLIVAC